MELIHGGDWAGYQAEYGRLPLDFSASVSPLPLPEGIYRAVLQALEDAGRYPDPLCRTLRARLAQRHGLAPQQVLCGGGAADLIFRLAAAARPRRALLTAPTFAEYEQALRAVGCAVQWFDLREEDGFAVTERILDAITPELDLLFLCEPNNPTGRTTDPKLLQAVLARCAECHVRLAVDECFLDLLDAPATHTLAGEVSQHPGLVILKSFTKHYPMAGLRLGYALCGDGDFLSKMAQSGPPWSVSTLAQAAGLAALEEDGYDRTLRDLITAQRPRLQGGLTALGCRVLPGEANFLLFHHPDAALAGRLREKGILLRDCSNYRGLGPGWYRTAVRTAQDNDALLRAMREVL